jgi:hypothetical protein
LIVDWEEEGTMAQSSVGRGRGLPIDDSVVAFGYAGTSVDFGFLIGKRKGCRLDRSKIHSRAERDNRSEAEMAGGKLPKAARRARPAGLVNRSSSIVN